MRRFRTLRERFEEKTCPEPLTGCLLWTGCIDIGGYGKIYIGEGVVGIKHAHCAAFFLKHGRWPEPFGLHKCDVRACVEADHVFEGTSKDNIQDMVRKGRHYKQALTHCPNGHLYDATNTILDGTTGARRCRVCRSAQKNDNRRRRVASRRAA